MKRKVSAHRVYDLIASRLYSFHVVERDEDGKTCLYPLHGEIQSTEWLPGLILLSPLPVTLQQGESYPALISRLSAAVEEGGFPPSAAVGAYWISPFSVSEMALLPRSAVFRLW